MIFAIGAAIGATVGIATTFGDPNIPEVLAAIFGAVVGSVSAIIYGIPTLIAVNREHTQTSAIGVLNFLAGWTFLGWVIAVVWAVSNNSGDSESLTRCLACGHRISRRAKACPKCGEPA